MHRPNSWFLVFFIPALNSSTACTDDTVKATAAAEAPAEERSVAELTRARYSELAKLPPGVLLDSIRKDEKGHIASFLVVGKSRISTVLGKAKGIEIARGRANLQASAEFVKWLKQDVRVAEVLDDETIILMTGTEGSDGETSNESGKTIEKTSTRMEAVSRGLVRGLVAVYSEIDADNHEYIVIKGWKADTAEAVKKVATDQNSDEPKAEIAKNGKTRAADEVESTPAAKADKEITSSKTISEGAGDFLPPKKE